LVNFFLFVLVPPLVVSFDTQNNTFEQNNPFEIHCIANGSPTPEIALLHNGNTLLTIKSRSSEYSNMLSWKVERLSPLDSGVYVCVARSELGMAQQNVSILVKGMV